MNQEVNVRLATEADLPAIREIYTHYVQHCTCTWRCQPQTPEQHAAWFHDHDALHPVTVADVAGQVVGWGALSEFRSFDGYRQTVENSVYVRAGSHGRGIGTAILADLIRRARELGHHSIVAVISADQKPSLVLHARHGFVEAGRLHECGQKFGQWLDVVFMEKIIR